MLTSSALNAPIIIPIRWFVHRFNVYSNVYRKTTQKR